MTKQKGSGLAEVVFVLLIIALVVAVVARYAFWRIELRKTEHRTQITATAVNPAPQQWVIWDDKPGAPAHYVNRVYKYFGMISDS